jgi:PAS domain S-box-containing protein
MVEPSGSAFQGKVTFALRGYLIALVSAALIPALIVGAAAVWTAVNSYRSAFEDRLRDTTRALALAVDAEIDTVQAAITVLAGSAALDLAEPDLATFRREADRAAARLGTAISLIETASLQQVVNTSLSPGAAVSPAHSDFQTVIRSRQPVVMNLATGPISGRMVASVAVPVLRSGEVTHVLVARLEPARLGAVLAAQTRGSGAFATLADRNNIIVARSRDHERFLGQKLLDWIVETAHGHGAGLLRGKNRLGEESISAFRRLSATPGWMIVFGYPVAAYNDALWRPVKALVIGSAVALALALLVAYMIGRRILHPVHALTWQALAVTASSGDAVMENTRPARIAEFERLRQATCFAERTLRQRAAEIAAGEARLRAVVETAADAIVVIDEEGTIQSFNSAASAIFGYAADKAIGRNVSILMGEQDAGQHDKHLAAYRQTGMARIIGIGREVMGRRSDGSAVPVDLAIAEWRDAEGKRFFTGMMRDISARKAEEARKALLMREVDHRAKNALAVVHSLVRLTPAEDPAAFVIAVQARVAALARAHSLLAEGGWKGTDLRTLIERELDSLLSPSVKGAFVLSGPVVALAATAVQPIAMMLHELATNAMRHGALAQPDGRVDVSWRAGRRAGEDGMLRLRWVEIGLARAPTAPMKRGFGMRAIEATVRGQLRGSIEWRWEASGLTAEIALPLTRMETDADASPARATTPPSPGANAA